MCEIIRIPVDGSLDIFRAAKLTGYDPTELADLVTGQFRGFGPPPEVSMLSGINLSQHRHVVVDITQIEFIDSTAYCWLMWLKRSPYVCITGELNPVLRRQMQAVQYTITGAFKKPSSN